MNKMFFSNLERDSLLFKRFQVIRCLNAHNHGAVYFCLDKRRKSNAAALKIISTEDLSGSHTGERFQNEIEVSKRVHHPNVLRCEGFYQDHVFTAFGMEYLNGGTLADYLEKHRRASWDEFIPLMLQLCAGLNAIHMAGIIHRDLKPENVLLTPNPDLKIADFGIAVIGDQVTCGEDDVMIGTLNYLSPEYIERGVYDRRSDIYSLGLLAFELITGTLPFHGKSPLEALTSRVKDKPQRPEFSREDCEYDLSCVVLKALEREPEKRYQTAKEFADALMQTATFEDYVIQQNDDPKLISEFLEVADGAS